MGPLWSHAVDYLMLNARVLLDAPLVFLATLVLAFGVVWWLAMLKYGGAIHQKDGTIESLKTQIDALERQIAEMRADKDV